MELMSNLKGEFLNTLNELAPDVDDLEDQDRIIQLAVSKYNKISKSNGVGNRLSSRVKESQILDSILYALDNYSDVSETNNGIDRILRKTYAHSEDVGFDLADDDKDLHVFFDENDADDLSKNVQYRIHDEDGFHDNDDCFEGEKSGYHRTNWNTV
jgi:hypothetical protein